MQCPTTTAWENPGKNGLSVFSPLLLWLNEDFENKYQFVSHTHESKNILSKNMYLASHVVQFITEQSVDYAACRLFPRGVIFTRARVSLALLSLRKNGGLLVV